MICSFGFRSKRLRFISAGFRIGEASHPGPELSETIVLEGAAGKGQNFKQAAADPDILAKVLKARSRSESGKLLQAYCKAKAAKQEIKLLTEDKKEEKALV